MKPSQEQRESERNAPTIQPRNNQMTRTNCSTYAMSRASLVALFAIALSVTVVEANERATIKTDEEHRTALERAVALALRNLEQKSTLAKQDLASETTLDNARLKLAEARANLSEFSYDGDALLKHLQEQISIRQRQLNLVAKLVQERLVTDSSIDEARIKLGDSRIRLELHEVRSARERQLALQEKLHEEGLVPSSQVEKARIGLLKVRRRLAVFSR